MYMYFTLPGPVFSDNGTLETGSSSGWQSVRRGGKGLVSNVIYCTVGSSVGSHLSGIKWFR